MTNFDADITAYHNLLAYAVRVWPQYKAARHLALVAGHLQAVERGDIGRLIINMPPRHGKSMTCSEIFPPWYQGRNPSKFVIFTTYSQDHATDVGRKVRNHLIDPLHGRIFQKCRISSDSQSAQHFNTVQGGVYYSVGVGGPITGRGAHLLIIDDPHKNREEAESSRIRDAIKDWYRSTAFTRLEPGGAVILIQTRWHEDDLTGFVLREQKDEGWVQITLPALNEETGEALWSERYSVEQLKAIQAVVSPYEWNSLYQQRPSSKQGNILKREWWRYYQELPPRFEEMIQSWDFTFKDRGKNDYVVGQVWGRVGADCYLVYQFRKKLAFTETLRAFDWVTGMYPQSREKLIEDKANGPAVIDVVKKRVPGVIPIEPNGSKEERANAITYIIESGNVYLPDPKIQSWVYEFIEECAAFPNGKHDDQVDAMTQALSRLGGRASAVARLKAFVEM